MAKKIIILKGSPRKNGNSALLAEKIREGAQNKGASVEMFFLHGMNIGMCTACDSCREKSEKNCIIDDDMQILYPKLRKADALVIASPVYWFTVSGQTKVFMDRCYALGGPEGNALKGKKIGIAMTYADPDPFSSGAVNAFRTFQDGFAYVGAQIEGFVYGSAEGAGDIKSNKAVLKKAYELGEKLGKE